MNPTLNPTKFDLRIFVFITSIKMTAIETPEQTYMIDIIEKEFWHEFGAWFVKFKIQINDCIFKPEFWIKGKYLGMYWEKRHKLSDFDILNQHISNKTPCSIEIPIKAFDSDDDDEIDDWSLDSMFFETQDGILFFKSNYVHGESREIRENVKIPIEKPYLFIDNFVAKVKECLESST